MRLNTTEELNTEEGRSRCADRFKDIAGIRERERDIVISPFYGHYGLAGYVITVQGSPTYMTCVIDLSREQGIYYSSFATGIQRFGGNSYKFTLKKTELWNACMRLLLAHGLRTDTGGENDVPVTVIKNGIQEWTSR